MPTIQPRIGDEIHTQPSASGSLASGVDQRPWPVLALCNPASVWRVTGTTKNPVKHLGYLPTLEHVRNYWPGDLEQALEHGAGI